MCLGLLLGFGIIDTVRLLPYGALLTCYTMAIAAFAFVFGFIIDRSEYYALPIFLLNTILSVVGCFVGKAYAMSESAKLFLGFLSPTIGMSNGIFAIETFLYHHPGLSMDYGFYDMTKHYPSLQATNGMLGCSMLVYLFIAWGGPFDWLFSFRRVLVFCCCAVVQLCSRTAVLR